MIAHLMLEPWRQVRPLARSQLPERTPHFCLAERELCIREDADRQPRDSAGNSPVPYYKAKRPY